MAITRPRGVNDFLPPQTAQWRALEALLHLMCEEYGFGEIRTPIFEETELFQRGVGDTTDIVQKEMYTFDDRGGRSLTLRPENTASVCRAYAENKLYGQPQPQKLYYLGPMFRYERPQAGRYRQFHQFGLELIGSGAYLADAEIIAFAWDFFRRLGISGMTVHLNSVGCPTCRATYRAALQDFLRPRYDELCENCRGRFERNPMRILDCKNPACLAITEGAPRITDYICAECREHFNGVQQALATAGIVYQLNPSLVRGLDYYTKTAFEIQVEGIGAQSALCGGGRYDGLMEELGGPPTPAVGYAMGLERVFNALEAQSEEIELGPGIDAYVIAEGGNAEALKAAFALCCDLRKSGVRTEMDYGEKSIKAQMKAANRLEAAYAVIIGEQELAYGKAQVRDMKAAQQIELPFADVREYLLGR